MNSLFQWLTTHHEPMNIILNFAILLVWLFYAHLLYMNFKRRRRPKILISQVQGNDLDATCMVSNMSEEAIHIDLIIVYVQDKRNDYSINIGDHPRKRDDQSSTKLHTLTYQGPMHSGGNFSIGTFSELIDRTKREEVRYTLDRQDAANDIQIIEIRIVAEYGAEKYRVGAKRGFRLKAAEGGNIQFLPISATTKQIYGLRGKHFYIPEWEKHCANIP